MRPRRGPAAHRGLGTAFWTPDWRWIAADDGWILVITTGRHPVTRVLTSESSREAFSPDLARFAVTGANLLTPSSRADGHLAVLGHAASTAGDRGRGLRGGNFARQ